MRRAGSGEAVRAILDRLRAEVPGLTLRTTLLVGYPGESEADAEQLLEFVRTYELGRMGAFPYSPEEGTHGATLAERPDAAAVEGRLARLFATRDEVLRKSQERLVGRTLEVLVDELHGERAIARAAEDAPEVDLVTEVQGCRAPVGTRLQVVVQGVDAHLNLVARPLIAAGAKGRRA
jgi:ribosomal protein S12 methylthiotransferase